MSIASPENSAPLIPVISKDDFIDAEIASLIEEDDLRLLTRLRDQGNDELVRRIITLAHHQSGPEHSQKNTDMLQTMHEHLSLIRALAKAIARDKSQAIADIQETTIGGGEDQLPLVE